MCGILHVVIAPFEDRRHAAGADVALELAAVRRQQPVLPGVRVGLAVVRASIISPDCLVPGQLSRNCYACRMAVSSFDGYAEHMKVTCYTFQTAQRDTLRRFDLIRGIPNPVQMQCSSQSEPCSDALRHTSSPSAPPLKLVEL